MKPFPTWTYPFIFYLQVQKYFIARLMGFELNIYFLTDIAIFNRWLSDYF